MITFDYATEQDLIAVYGKRPERTVRALAFRNGEKVIGCAGLYVDEGRMVLFADITDEIRKQKRVVVRAYRMLLDMARRTGLVVHAVPDQNVEASERFLRHMGFEHLRMGVYQWQA